MTTIQRSSADIQSLQKWGLSSNASRDDIVKKVEELERGQTIFSSYKEPALEKCNSLGAKIAKRNVENNLIEAPQSIFQHLERIKLQCKAFLAGSSLTQIKSDNKTIIDYLDPVHKAAVKERGEVIAKSMGLQVGIIRLQSILRREA